MAKVERSFSHSQRRVAPGILCVEVNGYLDADTTVSYLDQLRLAVDEAWKRDKRSVGLIFMDALTGFDTGRVSKLHGEWLRQLGDRLLAVAIVSSKLSVRFGVVAAKLVTRQPIEVHQNEEDAWAWLESARLKDQGTPGGHPK